MLVHSNCIFLCFKTEAKSSQKTAFYVLLLSSVVPAMGTHLTWLALPTLLRLSDSFFSVKALFMDLSIDFKASQCKCL